MLITYRAKDIDGPEFAAYYYMSQEFGSWTKRPLVPIMKDGNSTGKLQGANPDAILSASLMRGEEVYLAGESPITVGNIYVPYTLNTINSKFTEFVEFCRDTENNNHCVGSDVHFAAELILKDREAVGAEFADIFIQWLIYGGVPFG